MLPLTKLVRTVGRGFRREKMVQTVTWTAKKQVNGFLTKLE